MPLKNAADRAAYKLKWSQRPAQRAKQKARRASDNYLNYMRPLQRKSHLRRYGITHEDYNRMLSNQNYECAICHTVEPGTSKSNNFDVDHDHITGKVRALLCRKCNVTLGHIEGRESYIAQCYQYAYSFYFKGK